MRRLPVLLAILLLPVMASAQPGAPVPAQNDPAREPAVVALSKVLPAVVNINTERIVHRAVRDPYDELFERFYNRPMRPRREFQQKVQSLGSGFIVDPAGYIVTNEHVVERAADLKIQVTLADGQTYNATYVAGDAGSDLAFIKIEAPKPLSFINLADLSPNLLGQTVLVVGNPLGYGSSVSRGILSALNRSVSVDEADYKDLLQTDAAINPGNSGGPLVDLSGRLVGVSSLKLAFTPDGVPTQGLGFAIPGEKVREKIAEFRRAGEGGPGRLSAAQRLFGIQTQALTADLTRVLGLAPVRGVLVSDVEQASPAEQAGIERGQIILQIGNHQVSSVQEVEKLLAQAKSGTRVDFVIGAVHQVRRQDVPQIATVRVAAR